MASQSTYKPKADKRHATIAKSKRDEEENLKSSVAAIKAKNKDVVKKRREEIRKMPKDERPAAKEALAADIAKMKEEENVAQEKYKAYIRERKESEARSR
ncbi:MAG: hypothetical protein ACOX8L_04925 [Candidatus Methanomethylophilaceae archaeon]|jgi:hypothetical protein